MTTLVIGWWVQAQVLLAVVLGVVLAERAVDWLGARDRLWFVRSCIAAGLLLPLVDLPSEPMAPALAIELSQSGDFGATLAPHPAVSAELSGVGVPIVLLTCGAVLALLHTMWRYRLLASSLARAQVRRQYRRVVVATLDVPTPFAVRWAGRAWVVLDPVTWSDPEARCFAIAHELQHHRQRDTSLAGLQHIVGALLVPSPFAWMLGRHLRLVEELACDQAVVERHRDRRGYAKHLIATAHGHLRFPAPALRGSSLRQRLEALMNNSPQTGRARQCGLLLIASSGIVTAACATDDMVSRTVDTASPAIEPLPASDNRLVVDEGKTLFIRPAAYRRILVSDDAIAELKQYDVGELGIRGLARGETDIIIWPKGSDTVVHLDLVVTEPGAAVPQGQPMQSSKPGKDLSVDAGKSLVMQYEANPRRVYVSDSDLVEVRLIEEGQFIVSGKATGETDYVVWPADGGTPTSHRLTIGD